MNIKPGSAYNKLKVKFAQGGQLPGDDKPGTKTYTNKAEYDKALQAYNDSLVSFKNDSISDSRVKKLPANISYTDLKKSLDEIGNFSSSTSNKKVEDLRTFYYPPSKVTVKSDIVKKPVVKPEYKEAVKKQEPTYADSLALYNKYKDYVNSDANLEKYGSSAISEIKAGKFSDKTPAAGWAQSYIDSGVDDRGNKVDSRIKPTGVYYYSDKNGEDPVVFNYPKPIGKQAKGTLEQEVKPTMAKGVIEDDSKNKPIWMPDGTKKGPNDFKSLQAWQKASGQKFAAGGNFTPYGSSSNPYGQLTPMQPNYPTSVGNNYVSSPSINTPTPSTPNMKASTMGTSGNSKPGVSDIAGYAGMANQAMGMFNTTQNDDYMMGNDATVSGIKDGVKQVPVAGQFVALGDTSSDMLYQQASKTSGVDSTAWAGAAGTVSPSSGWEKKNDMYKSGEIDSTEFGVATLAHFVMPGLDTMYLQDKHNTNVDSKKRNASLIESNQPMYDANMGAYDDQMSYLNNKSFGKGGKMCADGGQMTTEYKNGGTHEQNPNGGIPVGNNLVEEGEIRFDYLENKQPKSYIFSNRIKFKK